MKTIYSPLRIVCACAALAFVSASGVGAADSKEDLKARFQERNEALLAQKAAGTVGETAEGYVEAVNGQPLAADAATLLAAENRDRRALYAILAQEQGASASEVGRQSAIVKFKKAGDDEWFKGKDGTWRQKRDMLGR